MEFDPATVLFGVVVMLLVAILVGIGISAAFGRPEPEAEWISQELDELLERVATMGEQITTLSDEVEQLYEEIEHLEDDKEDVCRVLLRIAELLERFPRSGMK